MSEPNYHEINATVTDLDEQIEALQSAKRDFWKGIRDEHGKKLTDQIKLAVKLNRMDGEKRVERDEIEEGAFHILSILQKPRAPRATRAREIIEEFDAETGEITDTASQPIEPNSRPGAGPTTSAGEEIPVTNPPRPATLGDDDGHRSTPSPSVGGAKSEGVAPPSLVGAPVEADIAPAQEGQAVTNSPSSPLSPETDRASAVVTSSPAADATDFVVERDVPTFLLGGRKSPADYRPHCLHPDACAASDLTHCYSCRKQLALDAETEAA